MLKHEDLVRKLTDDLARLQVAIHNRGLLQRLDLHKAAERLFCSLLNRVYSYQLRNLNFVKPNHPAIDLGDEAAGLGLQVTSQNDKAKVQATLDTAFRHGIYQTYSHLKIFIIGKKEKNYGGLIIPTGIVFDAANDVFDVGDVLKRMEQLDVPQLARISEYFDAELVSLNERLVGDGPTAKSHDREIFYEADLMLDEATLNAFLYQLSTNHLYSTADGGSAMWNFFHHFELESNRFISDELNDELDKVRAAVHQLMTFLTLNCFHRRYDNSKYLFLRPEWNEDRDGDGGQNQQQKYRKVTEEMELLITAVRNSYRTYRKAVKMVLAT